MWRLLFVFMMSGVLVFGPLSQAARADAPTAVGQLVVPGQATLISPHERIGTRTPTYIWQAVATATRYEIWVSHGISVPINRVYSDVEAGCQGNPRCSVTPVEAMTMHLPAWWWVRAGNDAGWGPWSHNRYFLVQRAWTSKLTAPVGSVSTSTPTFTWTQDDPVPVYWSPTFTRTQWFQLWVTDHTGSRFTRWYHVNEVWRSAEYSVRPPIALPEGEAWFWVRGWDPLYADTGDDVGLTGWTLAGSFTVLPSVTVLSGAPVGEPVEDGRVRLWALVRNSTATALPDGYQLRFWAGSPTAGMPMIGAISISGLSAGSDGWYYLDWVPLARRDLGYQVTVFEGTQARSEPGPLTRFVNGFDDDEFFDGPPANWEGDSGDWTGSGDYLSAPGRFDNGQHAYERWGSYGASGTPIDLTVTLQRFGCVTCANRVMVRGLGSWLERNRFGEWPTWYAFQYTAEGHYSVYMRKEAVEGVLQPWTPAGSIATGSASNVLRVVIDGASLWFYINGTLVWAGTDYDLLHSEVSPGRSSIGVGFYSDVPDGNELRLYRATMVRPSAPAVADQVDPAQQLLNEAARRSPSAMDANGQPRER